MGDDDDGASTVAPMSSREAPPLSPARRAAGSSTGSGGGAPAPPPGFVDLDLSYLHPSQRPLTVVLQVGRCCCWKDLGGPLRACTDSFPLLPSSSKIDGIVVDYRNQMRAPRAVCFMFPLPYEDSNSIPDRAKVVRQGTVFDLRCGGVRRCGPRRRCYCSHSPSPAAAAAAARCAPSPASR